jgi:glutathione synthase/RimK-type ligase-like ATP-grasp enzyme
MSQKIVGLVRSPERFEAFRQELSAHGCDVREISFDSENLWSEYDFASLDAIIFFPSFQFASSHPLALRHVQDQLAEIHRRHPHIKMFPDPALAPYYGDKVRQQLFLSRAGFPVPRTVVLETEASMLRAEQALGFPMVVKNRFGAGGDYVFLVENRKQLRAYFNASNMRFSGIEGWRFASSRFLRRSTIRGFFGDREAYYPLLSAPLLAQEFVPHDSDLKTVVGDGTAVEFHWRRKADKSMWKMNIDGGGIGEWSYVPPEPLELSVRLAKALGTKWLNTDLLHSKGQWFISEFSPVWHHYKYREMPSLRYEESYNGPIDAERASKLETLIVKSYLYGHPLASE